VVASAFWDSFRSVLPASGKDCWDSPSGRVYVYLRSTPFLRRCVHRSGFYAPIGLEPWNL